jgi:serine/threonine protein phosphatase 1
MDFKENYRKNKLMRRFILGDIHGREDYLKQVLERSGFDKEEDWLCQVGDITDRGWGVFEAMNELLAIKNLILIAGNHDLAFIDYLKSNRNILGSAANGTHMTISKWKELTETEKKFYKAEIFDKMIPYYITEDNIMITHGGFPLDEKLEEIEPINFAWDRELVNKVVNNKKIPPILYDFKKIIVGHTPTIYWDTTKPIIIDNFINIDTGSGKGGPLTIMNLDTEEYWQSDF